MPSTSFSLINRRGFLRLGIVAGMLGAAGCDDGGTQTITTPPPANGNRSRLKALQEKADEIKTKQKK